MKLWRFRSLLFVVALIGLLGGSMMAEAKTTVRFATWGTQWEAETYKEIVDAFQKKNPDIAVTFEYSDWDTYWTKLQTQMAAGLSPDVMRMSGAFLGQFAKDGALMDLQALIDRDKLPIEKDYFNTMGIFKVGGHYFGLPEGGDITGLYYNVEAFDEAGLGYPTDKWTWSDFQKAASRLTIRQADTVKRYGAQVSFWGDGQTGYRSFILQAEGQLLNEEKTKAAVQSPQVMEAIKFLAGMVQRDKSLTPPTWSGSAVTGFTQGTFAMITGLVPVWIKQASEAKFEWDVAPLPIGKRRAATSNYVGFVMAKSTKVRDAAWRLMKFIVGPDGQRVIARNRQMLPPLKSVAYSNDFLNPSKPPIRLREVIAVTTPHTFDLQFTPGFGEWSMAVGTEVAAAVGGTKSVEEAMKTAADRVNAILSAANK